MINLVPALLDQSNLLRYQAKEREKCGSERINNGQVFVRHSGYAMLSFMPALVCRVARIFCTDHLVHKAVPENGAHRLDLQVVQIRLPLGVWCRQSTHAQSRDVLMQSPMWWLSSSCRIVSLAPSSGESATVFERIQGNQTLDT